jgi:hypothetical protein
MVSTATFGILFLLLDFATTPIVASLYSSYTGVRIRDGYEAAKDTSLYAWAHVFYMDDPKKRDAVLSWPTWKVYLVSGAALSGISVVASAGVTGAYEWLARRNIKPLVKLVAGVSCIGL